MSDTHYYIEGTDCLKNKLGLTDSKKLEKKEYAIVTRKVTELEAKPLPGKIDYSYFKAIHKALFQDIYEWAGKERDIQTEKNIRFELPKKISITADKLFAELKNENNLSGLDRSGFINRAAHYFGELNVVHPFPEGNGRAQRALFDKLAKDAGFKFNWGKTSKVDLINALNHAFAIDSLKLEEVFEKTVSEIEREVTLVLPADIKYSIENPVSDREYKNAKAIVDKERTDVVENLFPTHSAKSELDDIKTVAVNRALKSRVPDQLKTVKKYESNKQANALLSQLMDTNQKLSQAVCSADINGEKRHLKKKAAILNTLINRKSIAQTLPSSMKQSFKVEKENSNKLLSLYRSRGFER